MAQTYTPDQFWKLYENLKPELREAIFSEDSAINILEICLKNGVAEDKISEVARYTGRVLLGVLPPIDFQKTLEQELGIGQETAKKIAQEINRMIFYPVKPALEELYNTGFASPNRPTAPTTAESAEQSVPQRGEDNYREPIE
ncbi:MAG: hypothetical protein ABH813_00865 [Patescibacteria group bacterium]